MSDSDYLIPLKLSAKLEQEQIVTKYDYNKKINSLVLRLNHKYEEMVITSPVKVEWPTVIDILTDTMNRKQVDPKHITMISDAADNNSEWILEQRQESADQGSTARKLLEMVKDQQEVFVDQYNEPYAAVKIKDHVETLGLDHQRYKNWIAKQYFEKSNRSVPNSESISSAINKLKADAEFDGNSKVLHQRVAWAENDTAIYYDLTNKDWEAVKITAEGRQIVKAPVIFRRYNAQPQVYPSDEYPANIMNRFIALLNVKDEDKKLLLKCYIIACLIPVIDKCILMSHGGPGAAKSSSQELIKMVLDPSTALTLALPKNLTELNQQLSHYHVAYYDNISRLPTWISDALCMAATGGSASKRKLWTDDEDKIANIKNCTGFNGINLAATRGDLLDRGFILESDRIDDRHKRRKREILKEFEELKPQLLGYIFDILVKALRMKQQVGELKFEKLPRMVDFAEWAEIISRCMGNKDNAFIDAYYRNIALQAQEVLNDSLVASAIISLMGTDSVIHGGNKWEGSATQLLERLYGVTNERTHKLKWWPKAPNVLSRRLNEVKTHLSQVGIVIEYREPDKITNIRTIIIRKMFCTNDSNDSNDISGSSTGGGGSNNDNDADEPNFAEVDEELERRRKEQSDI